MHEIINLSYSHQANHLNTHFYNAQKTYFVYDDANLAESYVDPTVRFRADAAYTPRAALWELNGGFGRLRKHHGVYAQLEETEEDVNKDSALDFPVEQVNSNNQHNRTPVDSGNSHTAYWSDYLDVTLHPTSLITIPGWQYDPIACPRGRPVGEDSDSHSPFWGYDIGEEVYKQVNRDEDYLDVYFRRLVEQCDLFAGISVATHVDSAFGAFTGEMLAGIRDNYSTKADIFVWGLHHREKLSRQFQLARVQTMLNLLDSATLYMPLVPPDDFSSQGAAPNNDYLVTAAYSTVYEPYSLLSSLRNVPRVSMAEMASTLTQGTKRNIVCASSAVVGSTIDRTYDFGMSGLLNDEKPDRQRPQRKAQEYIFTKTGVVRAPKRESTPAAANDSSYSYHYVPTTNPWDSVFAKAAGATSAWDKYFGQKELTDNSTPWTKYECPEPFALPASYPRAIVDNSCEVLSCLAVTNAPQQTLKSMDETVFRFSRGDGRDEMRERLGELYEAYSGGWEGDDEELDFE